MTAEKERGSGSGGRRSLIFVLGLAAAALFFFLGWLAGRRWPPRGLPRRPAAAGPVKAEREEISRLPSREQLETIAGLCAGYLLPAGSAFTQCWEELRDGELCWWRLVLKGRCRKAAAGTGAAALRSRLRRDYPGLVMLFAPASERAAGSLLLLAGERVVLIAELLCPRFSEPRSSSRKRPQLALIIDDMGRNLESARQLAAVPLPLTFAVFPRLPQSRCVAEFLRSQRRDIILHLPMEPKGWPRVKPGPGALFMRMDAAGFSRVLEADLAALPGIIGVNNHMGSRLTEDPAKMALLMKKLKGTGLFFIDSRTIADSVAFRAAQRAGIPALARDVFLDNRADEHYILGQFRTLLEVARVRGHALGIGHPYPETVRALARFPEMAAQAGVAIVSLKELVREQAGAIREQAAGGLKGIRAAGR